MWGVGRSGSIDVANARARLDEEQRALLKIRDQWIHGRCNAQLFNVRSCAEIGGKRTAARATREIDSDCIGILARIRKKLLTAPARRAVDVIQMGALVIDRRNYMT